MTVINLQEMIQNETDKLIPQGITEELSPCCTKPLIYQGKEYPICSECRSEIIIDYCS